MGSGMSGLGMVVKALGIDPVLLMQKVSEFEGFVKALGNTIQAGVAEMNGKMAALDARLERMEAILAATVNKVDSAHSSVIPAGDCWAPAPESEIVVREN